MSLTGVAIRMQHLFAKTSSIEKSDTFVERIAFATWLARAALARRAPFVESAVLLVPLAAPQVHPVALFVYRPSTPSKEQLAMTR